MYKLAIYADDRDEAHHFAGLLGEILEPAAEAVSVFENDSQWLVEGYFAQYSEAESAAAHLGSISLAGAPTWSVEEIGDRNWVALSQAALPPVHAGRFTVFGSHDRSRVGCGPNRILIDAGEAFGTAHHATTYGCLLAIDRLTRRRRFQNILDLGTGSGVLALALHRALPHAHILATDLDARSVEVAQANARINGDMSIMHGRMFFVSAPGLRDKVIRRAQPFDLIVANILAGPLMQMAGDISPALATGGMLVLSGILVEQAAEVAALYTSHNLHIDRHTQSDNWSTLVMIKR